MAFGQWVPAQKPCRRTGGWFLRMTMGSPAPHTQMRWGMYVLSFLTALRAPRASVYAPHAADCHAPHVKVGPACLNGCPASTKTMKPQFCAKKVVSGKVPCSCARQFLGRAIRQRIQSSQIPPCHKHMVIATTLSVHSCVFWGRGGVPFPLPLLFCLGGADSKCSRVLKIVLGNWVTPFPLPLLLHDPDD